MKSAQNQVQQLNTNMNTLISHHALHMFDLWNIACLVQNPPHKIAIARCLLNLKKTLKQFVASRMVLTGCLLPRPNLWVIAILYGVLYWAVHNGLYLHLYRLVSYNCRPSCNTIIRSQAVNCWHFKSISADKWIDRLIFDRLVLIYVVQSHYLHHYRCISINVPWNAMKWIFSHHWKIFIHIWLSLFLSLPGMKTNMNHESFCECTIVFHVYIILGFKIS